MCPRIPMQIPAINGHMAHCEVSDVARDASLFMLQEGKLQADMHEATAMRPHKPLRVIFPSSRQRA
jgi:hydrogenase maturation factor